MPTESRDMELWKQWKKSPTRTNASELANQLYPLLKADVYRNATNVAPAVMEVEAKKLILDACRNYRPASGATLSTFVKSYAIKLSNINQRYRSDVKIPENRNAKFNTFKRNYNELASDLGRDPTVQELADKNKWAKAEVSRFLKEIRGEYTEDRPFSSNYNHNSSREEDLIDYIYHDLTTREKMLLEYTTGYGGKPKLTGKQIQERMGVNQNQLSYEKKKLTEKIDRMLS